MPAPLHVLAKAALFCVVSVALSSCVAYTRYEATALAMEKYRALAESRGDSIEEMRWAHLKTYRENEALEHEARLRDTELHSTRTQYAQLQVANTDVVSRYDRSLALATFENEGNYSARQRLSEAALRREADAIRATRREEAMASLVETQETEIDELQDEIAVMREVNARRTEAAEEIRTRVKPIREPREVPSESELRYRIPTSEALREQARRLGQMIDFAELTALTDFGSDLVSVTDEGHQYVVRVSESACFSAGRRVRMAGTGRAVVEDLARTLYGRDLLEVSVHPVSKREGNAIVVTGIEREQAAAIVEILIENGLPPANVRALDDAQFAGRVTRIGQLGPDSSMDGEMIFVIAPRPAVGLSMR